MGPLSSHWGGHPVVPTKKQHAPTFLALLALLPRRRCKWLFRFICPPFKRKIDIDMINPKTVFILLLCFFTSSRVFTYTYYLTHNKLLCCFYLFLGYNRSNGSTKKKNIKGKKKSPKVS